MKKVGLTIDNQYQGLKRFVDITKIRCRIQNELRKTKSKQGFVKIYAICDINKNNRVIAVHLYTQLTLSIKACNKLSENKKIKVFYINN